jgi:hypothetical protein
VLRDQFGEPVADIARDRRTAPPDAVDVAVMDLAEPVVEDATSIGDADLKPLRELSVRPDASLAELEPELLEVLVVGRPIATS